MPVFPGPVRRAWRLAVSAFAVGFALWPGHLQAATNSLSAQMPERSGSMETDPQAYRIDVWSVDQGLPQSSVTSIIQTRDGYLWLGTFNGLVRFDGVEFKVFDPGNTPQLPSNRILSLLEGRHGSFWIGTEEGDLVRCQRNLFAASSPPDRGAASASGRALAETSDGSVWILTFEGRLLRFSAGQFAVLSTNWSLHGTTVQGMATDASRQLWIGTDEELATWQGQRFVAAWDRTRESGFGVEALATSQLGGCWVVGNGRVRRFDQGKWVADYGAFPPAKGTILCAQETSAGQLWLGTYGSGLFLYQANGPTLHWSTQQGLPSDFIRCFAQDREGNFWAGTEGGGLVRLKPALFRSYTRKQGLSGDCMLSVCEGEDGELWIGTNGDGVNRMKNGVFRHYGAEQGLTNEFVWSVLQDHNRTLWAGTWGGGLFKLEGEMFVPFACENQGASVICCLFEDSKGQLCLGQRRAEPELVRLCNRHVTVLKLPSRLAHADVRTVAEDRAGNLWIGTFDDGLYRLRSGQVVRFGQPEGLSSERIRSLYADGDGVLWIGTAVGGLNRLEGGRFTSFTVREGLPDNSILHIEEDGRRYLWCSCGAGIFRVNKEELTLFDRTRSAPIHCFNYTKADGLPSLEFSGGSQPAGCKTRDGRIWFPTVHGLAVVDPERVVVNSLPPPVLIEEVVMEEKGASSIFRVPNWDAAGSDASGLGAPIPSLKIQPGQQRFEIRYTGLSFTAPEKVRFKYRLEGLEESWVDAGARRTAIYSYLRPGAYRFEVLACNNDGVWSDKPAALALRLLPHFWQTWWFVLLSIAGLVLLLAGAYEVRLASERRLARLRLRLARDLHDEVGSNLGSIALLSEVMPRPASGLPEEVSEIRRIAQLTIDSLRDIVWLLDPSGDNPHDLILRMKDTAKTMLPGMAAEFRSEAGGGSARVPLEFRRNVLPLFKEILHNIARHARATRVDIAVEFGPGQFRLQIRDNGAGFDPLKVRAGNGLKNLHRRAADLNGTLVVDSLPGAGTTVTLTAPIT